MSQDYNNIFNQNDMLELQSILRKNKETITSAESCTGGLIASMITEISGSSNIFNGSIVTYANEVKEKELGVKKETMIEYGVVSKEVVTQMLEGVLKKFNADYAVAVSGVAGPSGGTKYKPVGTVVIGAMTKSGKKSIEMHLFHGERKDIQIQASKHALKKIFKFIKNSLDK